MDGLEAIRPGEAETKLTGRMTVGVDPVDAGRTAVVGCDRVDIPKVERDEADWDWETEPDVDGTTSSSSESRLTISALVDV